MRNLVDVLDVVIELVPADQRSVELRARLRACRTSAAFSPPEMMRERWGQCSDVLNGFFEANRDLIDEPWALRLARIWADEEALPATVAAESRVAIAPTQRFVSAGEARRQGLLTCSIPWEARRWRLARGWPVRRACGWAYAHGFVNEAELRASCS